MPALPIQTVAAACLPKCLCASCDGVQARAAGLRMRYIGAWGSGDDQIERMLEFTHLDAGPQAAGTETSW